jgi:hypothetical protein
VAVQVVLLLQQALKVQTAYSTPLQQLAVVLPADITALVVLAVLAVAVVWAIVAPRLQLEQVTRLRSLRRKATTVALVQRLEA